MVQVEISTMLSVAVKGSRLPRTGSENGIQCCSTIRTQNKAHRKTVFIFDGAVHVLLLSTSVHAGKTCVKITSEVCYFKGGDKLDVILVCISSAFSKKLVYL